MIKCLLQREQIQANKEVCGYDCFWIWIKLLRYRNMFFLRAFLHTILIWNTVGVDGSVKSEWLFFLFWSHSKISSTVNNCEGYSVRDLILSHDTEIIQKIITSTRNIYWDAETTFPVGIWNLPSTLIHHGNGTFRERSSNRKNLKTPVQCGTEIFLKTKLFETHEITIIIGDFPARDFQSDQWLLRSI